METTDFGWAIRKLKSGKRVCRAGWNGKGMWLLFIDPSKGDGPRVFDATAKGLEFLPLLPWIGMRTADFKFVPWLASQTDVLAEDWAEAA